METRKRISPGKIRASRTTSSSSNLNDYAKLILWVAIVLQALFLVGSYWKNPLLTSTPIFLAQFLAPATILVIAETWQRAFKYSLFSTFVIPGGVSLILVLAGIISYILKPSMGGLLKHVAMSIKTSLVVWIVVLSVAIPSITTGIIIRIVWSKIRPNRNN